MASARPAPTPAARIPTPTTRLVGDGELSGRLGAAAGGPPRVEDGELTATPGARPPPGSPPAASLRDPKHSRPKPETYWPGSSCNVLSPDSRDANRSHGPESREHRTRRCRRDGVTRMDRWGHGGATSGPRATGSQRTTPVNTGPPSAEVSGQTPPPAAGRHDPPEISDTEGVTGSNRVAPTRHNVSLGSLLSAACQQITPCDC